MSKRVIALSQSLGESEGKTRLLDGASRFADLVVDRNNLLHGRPGTDQADGMARLFRAGHPWTVQQIREVADELSESSIILNDCFHGFLKELIEPAG